MAICPNCGALNNDSSKFCISCGAPLPVPQPAEQPAVQPAQPAPQESVELPNPQNQYWQQPATAPEPERQPEAIPIVPAQPVYAQPITQPIQNRANRPKTNGWCMAGFVLSIIGWCTVGLTSIPGLICSLIGLIVVSKKREPGKGKAVAGLIISGVLIFAMAISLPSIWPDVKSALDAGEVRTPMEFLDLLSDSSDRRTDLTDKYVKKIINNGWVAMENGSYLEFGKKQTYKYYSSYEDTSDNYYSGNYRMYSGENAVTQLTKTYKKYGVTKNEIKRLISNNQAFKEENFVVIVLENDGYWSDGDNVERNPEDTVFYGFLVSSPDLSLPLIDADSGDHLSFITADDYDKISTVITTTTTETEETTEATNEATTEATTETTTSADSTYETMGDSATGTVTLTQGKWNIWADQDLSGTNFESVAGRINRDTQTIINLCVYKGTFDAASLKSFAEALKTNMESGDYTNVQMTTTTLGGYGAYEVSGRHNSGLNVSLWLFLDGNNKFHYVTVEYYDSDKASYDMVKSTYKFN